MANNRFFTEKQTTIQEDADGNIKNIFCGESNKYSTKR